MFPRIITVSDNLPYLSLALTAQNPQKYANLVILCEI